MTVYAEIADSDIDPESPITTTLMTRMRNNPLAIQEEDATAPLIVFKEDPWLHNFGNSSDILNYTSGITDIGEAGLIECDTFSLASFAEVRCYRTPFLIIRAKTSIYIGGTLSISGTTRLAYSLTDGVALGQRVGGSGGGGGGGGASGNLDDGSNGASGERTLGAAAGAGGGGGHYPASGSAGSAGATQSAEVQLTVKNCLRQFLNCGANGGAGGKGGNSTGYTGGAGGTPTFGGGMIVLIAPSITFIGAGTINASGMNGGSGANGSGAGPDSSGGGGGAGGSGGGAIIFCYKTLVSDLGTKNVAGGAGGAGGTGPGAATDGGVGGAGGDGWAANIQFVAQG